MEYHYLVQKAVMQIKCKFPNFSSFFIPLGELVPTSGHSQCTLYDPLTIAIMIFIVCELPNGKKMFIPVPSCQQGWAHG